jgi:extracellular elastinolytic metalloproteinase
MSRELDRRPAATGATRLTPERESELVAAAEEASRALPGAQRVTVDAFDPTTGNPAVVALEEGAEADGNYVQRALEHVQAIGGALGFAPEQAAEFAADPVVQQAGSGARAVNLQQLYKGIPVYGAARTVRFTPAGAIAETLGSTITVPDNRPIRPQLPVERAVRLAAEHVAVPDEDEVGESDPFGGPLEPVSVDLEGFEPKVIALFTEKPDLPAVLERGPFGDEIKAALIWFPLDELRLAWEVLLTLGDYDEQYRTVVDAETGEILFCKQLVRTIAARGNVYRVDGGRPRELVDFPLALSEHGLPLPQTLPSGFPDHWVDDPTAGGNSVFAHLDDAGPTIRGTESGGRVVFDPADATGDDQKVLNIFFFNCVMHDYFYVLGFREREGNFQRDNLGRGGVAGDRVDARSYPQPVRGTATMATPSDGRSPTMRMGLVASTGRHTAFDSTVVYHEFMHGVTNRLVGGPMNVRALDDPQSGGMGEGWGDYVACTINDTDVVGAWVVDRALGIRKFRYDSNFPDTFAALGTGRYTEVHNIGEIWCATLVELNRQTGPVLTMQLVVDALKLSPANPSFLDMRDAILAALAAKLAAGQLSEDEHGTARASIWRTFAKFGMGPGARSDGAFLQGIVADFTPPVDPRSSDVHVEAAPDLAIPDARPDGVRSVVAVGRPGTIAGATVSLDIVHPYVGDLRVELVSPAGVSAVLHERTGAGADDIVRQFTSEAGSPLAPLVGTKAEGSWTLRVADLAKRDVGRLRRWGLDLELESETGAVRAESSPAVAIPDKDVEGISDTIAIAEDGRVGGVRVEVDITHTFVGDLRVALVAPSGREAVLHDRTGGGRDTLIETFASGDLPALAGLAGEEIAGRWVLRVSDQAGRDVGKLNRWALSLER